MRPSIALSIIVKNERDNLPKLLASVQDCFDHIYVTDTGSDDGTIELLQSYETGPNPANTALSVHHFTWCDDFSAARNASYEPVKEDFCCWLDGDDVLSDRVAFIKWRDEVMDIGDYWLATYDYAINKEGVAICSFARERVIRMNRGFSWKYFVHEGIAPISPLGKEIAVQYATTWKVVHMRTDEDLKKDRSRNLRMFKDRLSTLDNRMKYYYGKELFENDNPMEAYVWLKQAVDQKDMELHDRILALQYAVLSAQRCNQQEVAVQLAHVGLQLAPQRAEFWVALGDSYIKMQRFQDALPAFHAAKSCSYVPSSAMHQTPIFTQEEAYRFYPRNQLARIYFHIGQLDASKKMLEEARALGPCTETEELAKEVARVSDLTKIQPKGRTAKVDDILISCYPVGFYEWDEDIYHEKGIGGSETAVVQMARELRTKTNRTIRVYNNRKSEKIINGVHYLPAEQITSWLHAHEPAVHISWRHAMRMTTAPSFVWCHDLMAPGIDQPQNYDKILCLSEFHKKYVMNLFKVPEEKVIVTRNGINHRWFQSEWRQEKYNSVVFSSSPDRGLERAMRVMDHVQTRVKTNLHVFYGFDNMIKAGRSEEAARIKGMMDKRPWVKFHGNLQQQELHEAFARASVWLYPTNFLETHCITALEMLACKVYPVVRAWGALTDTLREAAINGYADVLAHNCETALEETRYADAVVAALQEEKWRKVHIDVDKYSWSSVADEWLQFLPISR